MLRCWFMEDKDMAENRALSGTLRFHKFRGNQVVEIDGEAGVFLPFAKAGILYMDGSMFYNIYCPFHQDSYGNDYMVVRQKTQEDKEQGIDPEIIGNMKFWGVNASAAQSPKPPNIRVITKSKPAGKPPTVRQSDDDDLDSPF